MESRILTSLGKIAGLAGISIGTLMFIFRDILKANFIQNLGIGPTQSFSLVVSLIMLTFGIASIGILAWLISRSAGPRAPVSLYALALLGGLVALVLGATVYVAQAKPDPNENRDVSAIHDVPGNGEVKSFIYTHSQPDNPGPRYWSKSGSSWIEKTPNVADPAFFKTEKRINYGGCDGTVVSKSGEPNLQMLISDKGCPNMQLKFRRLPNYNWIGLSAMTEIN